MNDFIELTKINSLYIDRNTIKKFSKSVVCISSKKTIYMVYIFIGRKNIALGFKTEKEMQDCFNILNNTTKEQVKAKLKRIK